MQKIVPHLWFDTQAVEAANFYVSLFPNSKINHIGKITDTPSGDCDIVGFTLAGQEFKSISAGPYFKFNPSISFFVGFDSEEEIQKVWDALSKNGKVLMALDTYPWAKKYGWVADKYGLTWQLSMAVAGSDKPEQKITPLLMFTQDKSGKAKAAMEKYVSLFPDSKIDSVATYEKGEGDTEGFVKHARFTLCGQHFMAMDSSGPHQFVFNEAVSLVVNCEDQAEIDACWNALSAVPEAEQCGWLKDEFGVSWQITPEEMDAMMMSGDQEKINRVTQSFLKMKKFDIATLKKAAEGK